MIKLPNVPKSFNQKGFTIAEVMVATVVVVTIAYSTLTFFPMLQKTAYMSQANSTCRAYIDSAFDKFQSYGLAGQTMLSSGVATSIPELAANTLPTGAAMPYPYGGLSSQITNAAMVFPLAGKAMIGWTDSSKPTVLRTPGLLSGIVPLINGFYNQNYTACSASAGFTGTAIHTAAATAAGSLFPDPPADLLPNGAYDPTFSVTMTVVPYQLSTGTPANATFCAGNPHFVGAPQSTSAPNLIAAPRVGTQNNMTAGAATAFGVAGGTYPSIGTPVRFESKNPATLPSPDAYSVNSDLGFQVSLKVTYQASPSVSKTECDDTRVISYQSITKAPNPPTGSITVFGGNGLFGPANTKLVVQTDTMSNVLMCQDTSPKATWGWSPGATLSATYGIVPCELVSLCGKAPAAAALKYSGAHTAGPAIATIPATAGFNLAPPGGYNVFSIWKDNGAVAAFSNPGLNKNCVAQVTAWAVDPAGNVSAPAIISYGGPLPGP